MCRCAGGGGAARAHWRLSWGCWPRLLASPRATRSAPMAWVLRARAPAARLIAASRSGLGVRRSALSGVRPSACCTPALHRRRAPAKAAHGAQLEAPNCAVPLEEAPAQKSKCSYACLRIRWHGSPCGPAVREVVHQFSVEGPRVRGPIARFRS